MSKWFNLGGEPNPPASSSNFPQMPNINIPGFTRQEVSNHRKPYAGHYSWWDPWTGHIADTFGCSNIVRSWQGLVDWPLPVFTEIHPVVNGFIVDIISKMCSVRKSRGIFIVRNKMHAIVKVCC